MEIRKPRTNDPRENERWRDEVSRQVSASQNAAGNESLFWLLNEGKNPEQTSDIEGVQKLLDMEANGTQDARDAIRKIADIEAKIEMIAVDTQTGRDNARRINDVEILHFMEV